MCTCAALFVRLTRSEANNPISSSGLCSNTVPDRGKGQTSGAIWLQQSPLGHQQATSASTSLLDLDIPHSLNQGIAISCAVDLGLLHQYQWQLTSTLEFRSSNCFECVFANEVGRRLWRHNRHSLQFITKLYGTALRALPYCVGHRYVKGWLCCKRGIL